MSELTWDLYMFEQRSGAELSGYAGHEQTGTDELTVDLGPYVGREKRPLVRGKY